MSSAKFSPIGILTGGGDCPGLNPVIRAVVIKAHHAGRQVIGFESGWKGLYEGISRPLTVSDVEEIHLEGGTILGSSRTNPAKFPDGIEKCQAQFKKFNLEALIAVGGDDTLGFAAKLSAAGLPVVGVPKTIDNDLLGTDYTFGFDTAVSIAVEAIDRLRTTAKSHGRTMILEVMGRYTGWIATFAGIAGGADATLTPENPQSVEAVAKLIASQRQRGKKYSLIVVAEGTEIPGLKNIASSETDAFGHKVLGGIGEQLAAALKGSVSGDIRAVNLGHIQRGGSPTAADRILATSYGLFATKLVLEKRYGTMAVLRGSRLEAEPLATVQGGLKKVPPELVSVARHFSF